MLIKTDCRKFPGDKPCIPHKKKGKICSTCDEYSPVRHKTLIIKLDAIGDVLRTTSLLHSYNKTYPDSQIKWLTKKNAKDLFLNNELIDEVIYYEEPVTQAKLSVEEFDIIINLDPSQVSSALASFSKGKIKYGFGLDSKGKVFPFNEEAKEWFEMGAFDILKKANKKTYQQIIHEICCLTYEKGEIILNLNDNDKEFADNFIRQNKLKDCKIIIGINAGASDRWQFKKWGLEGYKELIKKLLSKYNCKILLFGGPEEADTNKELLKTSKNVIDTGGNNTLRQFISLLNIPQIVITGDTLALHIATALKKKVVCLFGPTSNLEIEDYGLITKIHPEMDCLVCYKNVCDFKPNCMDLISVETVFDSIEKEIK
jgi:ADP-heptose:LPS heptosyltransferase